MNRARLSLLLPVAFLAGCARPAASPANPDADAWSPEVDVAASGVAPVGPTHPFTVDDMLAMERISDPSASPDGKLVAFTVSTPDLAANKSHRDVWLAASNGAGARRLTSDPANDSDARFAPDGKSVYFLSSRGGGSTQVWRIAVDGGEATQVTTLPVDVNAVLPFPDGKRLLVALDVYPDAKDLDETAARDKATEGSKEHVRAFDQLPIRHWDAWDDGKRTHLFVVTPGGAAKPLDLMAGLAFDAPTKPFGDLHEVALSRDGAQLVFTSKMVGREDAWSTNLDLWLVPTDGSAKPKNLTAGNLATDTSPAFSHDGTKLAYLAMARPGFEADRQRVVVMDWKTQTSKTLTEGWDRSPGELAWSRDDRTLYVTAEDLGRQSLFAVDVASGKATPRWTSGTSGEVTVAGDRVVFAHDDLSHPVELWGMDAGGGKPHALTHLNDARVAAVDWGKAEQFTFTGAKGDTVYAWLVRPAGPPQAKVPVAFLIHGGPQGSFGDHFHYRWNPEAFAGHGYAAIMVDFHGSTGYGQGFTDAIRDDWGGAPYEDLMKGLDAALVKYPWLDKDHMAALGASYGGYMINWINGQTDRFKALVCHDGNLDETMAYFATEELWFPEWEHKGVPWENPTGFARQSPMAFVKNWKTPTLVVHGGKDFRVVETEGFATFTALQRKGVPSRLLYFPDENHWVLKPAHSKRWHQEVFSWIDRFTRQ